jgi:formimidoylglutamate deiminase
MLDLFFDSALTSSGWASDVRVTIDAEGWITSVASNSDAEGAERIPGTVVPGVPNVHSHAFQRAMAGLTERGTASGDSFWSWRDRMYAFLHTFSPDDVEAVAAQLFVELLRHGFTSVAEFHYLRNDVDGRAYEDSVETGLRIIRAAERAGIGLTLLPTLYRHADFGAVPAAHEQRRFVATSAALVHDVERLAARASGQPDLRVGLALHSLRAVAPDDLTHAVAAVQSIDREAPVHIHVAEQVREVERCLEWSGRRPVQWLMDHAEVDGRWCLIHATHVDAGEIEAVAASGAIVGLCPTTEANLGDGIFPLEPFLAAGGRFAIGTDSHVSRDPASELRMLEYGQRLAGRRRNVAAGRQPRSSARVLLDHAWAGGSQACGRRVGAIAAGQRADMVVLDSDHPRLAGRSADELLDSWVFSEGDTPVRHVMTGGRWVVRSGEHVAQGDILAAYRTVAERLVSEPPQLSIDLPD